MQSAQGNTRNWLLEFDTLSTGISPLMGWESSRDTMSEVKLEFLTKDQAINYAKKNNLIYLPPYNDPQVIGGQGTIAIELKNQLKAFGQLRGIRVHGLMMIPPQCGDPEDSRQFFCGLRELRDECLNLKVQGVQLNELSMGMTNDYKIAVEEGATLVRVGTAIFGERNPD